MSETNQSMSDKLDTLKDQAAEKLGEFKEKAGELKDQAAEKLGEAEEKLHELADKAKGVWNKMTGHADEEKK